MEDIVAWQERELEALKATQIIDISSVKTYYSSGDKNYTLAANSSGTITATFTATSPNAEYFFGSVRGDITDVSHGISSYSFEPEVIPQAGNGTIKVRFNWSVSGPDNVTGKVYASLVGNFGATCSWS